MATRFATDLLVLAEWALARVAGFVSDTPQQVPRVMLLDAAVRWAPDELELARRALLPFAPKPPKP